MSLAPYYAQGGVTLYQGHVLAVLAALPAQSVQVCVTSPPYWGLRAYGTDPQVWGNDNGCSHELEATAPGKVITGGTGGASAKQVTNAGSQYGNAWQAESGPRTTGVATASEKQNSNGGAVAIERAAPSATCTRCGCWAGELGSEPTPELFIAHLVEVFAAVHRVLRDDGVLFVNIGDSYAGSGRGPTGQNGFQNAEQRQGFESGYWADCPACGPERAGVVPSPVASGRSSGHDGDGEGDGTGEPGAVPCAACGGEGRVRRSGGRRSKTDAPAGMKAKDLVGIPWMLAFALRADGWYLRGDYIWSKPNPMPESVQDRCTRAHEYVFHFSKSARYVWDSDAIREPQTDGSLARWGKGGKHATGGKSVDSPNGLVRDQATDLPWVGLLPNGRNKRSVWTIPTQPTPEAHFATYPQKLVEPCVLAASRPGDVVLDPFAGSGTTLLVADRHGRQAVGIELNPEYAAIAARRLRADAPLLSALGIEKSLPPKEQAQALRLWD